MDSKKIFRIARGAALVLLPLSCLAGLGAVFAGPEGAVGGVRGHFIQFAILANLVIGVLLTTLPQEESKGEYELQGYWATLIATGALLPSALALVTVVIYLAGWAGREAGQGGRNALLWGSAIAVGAWFVAAFVCRGYARAANAIPSSHGELLHRLTQLKAVLKRLDPNFDPDKPGAFSGDPKMKEAFDQIASIESELKRPGLSWVLARGYVNVWSRQYRAEETVIEVAPRETALAEALYDELRLQGSEVENREDLLAKLRQAVNVIDPSARQYLKPSSTTAMPLTISTPSTLPEGTVDDKYTQPLLATGGTTPYSWTITVGEKPTELKLDEKTGVLSGTPKAVREFGFTVRVTDHGGQWAEEPLRLTINDKEPAKGTNAPVITTPTPLPESTLGKDEYVQTLKADGGTQPYEWKIIDGKPDCLELDPTTGVLKGTPRAAREYSFTVEVTDKATPPLGMKKVLRLTVSDPAKPRDAAEPGAVARAVLRTVRRSINEYRGQRWNGLIVARNRLLATMIFTSLTAYALLVIALLCDASPGAIAAASIFYLVGATVGLCGRLRAESQTGTAVEDYGLSAGRLVTIPLFSGLAAIGGVVFVAMLPHANTVFGPAPPPLAIRTASPLPGAPVGEDYKQLLQAKGGTEPYEWKITAGKPDWLSLDPKGVLSGKPAKAEPDKFAVQVSDSAGATEKREFALTVRQKEPAQAAPVEAPKKAASEKPAAEKPAVDAQPGKPEPAPAPAAGAGTNQVAEKQKEPPEQKPSAQEPAESGGTRLVPSLTDIFSLSRYPIALLVAAVFGLTPGLLFDRLLQQAERYKSDLKSSQATGETSQKPKQT